MHTETLRRLLAAAKGEEPTDTVIKNGRIINVFTNSVEDGLAVSIKDGYVTGIDPEAGLVLSGKTEVIDAGGRYHSHGFIDPHTHHDSLCPLHSIVP